jgi:hypothetical protein
VLLALLLALVRSTLGVLAAVVVVRLVTFHHEAPVDAPALPSRKAAACMSKAPDSIVASEALRVHGELRGRHVHQVLSQQSYIEVKTKQSTTCARLYEMRIEMETSIMHQKQKFITTRTISVGRYENSSAVSGVQRT